MEFEKKKEICIILYKVFHGYAFTNLPSVDSLRYIEDVIGISLEFKNHFEYLVPQVYGWQFMDKWVYSKSWSRSLSKEPKDKSSILKDSSIFLLCELERKGKPTYFEHSQELLCAFDKDTYKKFKKNTDCLKHAKSVCFAIFELLVNLSHEVKKEDETIKLYNEKAKRRNAVTDEIYGQCFKILERNGGLDLITVTKEFLDDLIKNKLMKTPSEGSFIESYPRLDTFWDRLCVEVQSAAFLSFSSLDLSYWIKREFEKLPLWKQNLIWFNLEEVHIKLDVLNDKYDFEDDVKNVDVENKPYYDLDKVTHCLESEIRLKAFNYKSEDIKEYIKTYYKTHS